jgi:uncharacterized protein YukE
MTDSNDIQLQRVENELAALRSDISALLDAWRTAQGLVRFVKWVGSLATAATAIYALLRMGLHR